MTHWLRTTLGFLACSVLRATWEGWQHSQKTTSLWYVLGSKQHHNIRNDTRCWMSDADIHVITRTRTCWHQCEQWFVHTTRAIAMVAIQPTNPRVKHACFMNSRMASCKQHGIVACLHKHVARRHAHDLQDQPQLCTVKQQQRTCLVEDTNVSLCTTHTSKNEHHTHALCLHTHIYDVLTNMSYISVSYDLQVSDVSWLWKQNNKDRKYVP